MDNVNNCITLYKEQLEKGDIQKAYYALIKYVLDLRSHLSKSLSHKYSFGNLSYGYMDYSYFPFFNDFLRQHKLRFGIVLNHRKIRIELWLMGQNAEVQKKYWDILKSTTWNKNQKAMPKYSVLEIALIDNIDFNDLKSTTLKIEKEAINYSEEIIKYLNR